MTFLLVSNDHEKRQKKKDSDENKILIPGTFYRFFACVKSKIRTWFNMMIIIDPH